MRDQPLACPEPVSVLAAHSARWGADRMLTQGAGGNTSVKVGGWLWVKGSGAWLADAAMDSIFVPVDLEGTLNAISEGVDRKATWRSPSGKTLRSSIETSLHAAIAPAWVVHLHTVHSMLRTSVSDGRADLEGLLKGLPWTWVDYARPGLPLALEILRVSDESTRIWMLGNHGLVVAGDEIAEAEHWLKEVEIRLRAEPSAFDFVFEETECPSGYHPAKYADAHFCASPPNSLNGTIHGMPAPDFAVFLGARLCPIEQRDEYAADYGHLPPVLVLEGRAVMVRDGVSENGELMLEALGRMLLRLPPVRQFNLLPRDEVLALLNWDAEKYRQSVSRS